jgi:hypothetical protein
LVLLLTMAACSVQQGEPVSLCDDQTKVACAEH